MLLMLLVLGFGNSADEPTVQKKQAQVLLCGHCGEEKGQQACCKAEGRTKCDSCRLFKDAIGCCKMTAGSDATICMSCGEIKGSEVCCKKEGRMKCGNCKMFKDSVACCKLASHKHQQAHKHGDNHKHDHKHDHGHEHDNQ